MHQQRAACESSLFARCKNAGHKELSSLSLSLAGWHTRSLAYTTGAVAAALAGFLQREGIFHDMSRKLWQFLEKRRAPGMEMRARFSLSMDFLPFKYYAAASAAAVAPAHNILIGGPHLRGTRAQQEVYARGREQVHSIMLREQRERAGRPREILSACCRRKNTFAMTPPP
jgi:hypothetical protein